MTAQVKAALAAALLTLGCATVTTATAQTFKPECSDNSRQCMTLAATRYIEGFIGHDGSKIPFADIVLTSETPGIAMKPGALAAPVKGTAFQNGMKMAPKVRSRNIRMFVDEQQHQVFALYLVDLELAKKGADGKPDPSGEKVKLTVHRTQRLRVENGLITEIEKINYSQEGTMDGSSGWPDR